MTAALQGLKVLDLSRVLAGPWCTMTLADLGAEVIKVESSDGDDTRLWGPPFMDTEQGRLSAYFSTINRNKKSIVVDMHSDAGKQIIYKLAAEADVVVENFKTGGAEKLGVGYETLAAINPKLVYCSISGYGRTGPWAHKPGYDFIIQGEGGIMSLTGADTDTPSKVGVAVVDITTGQNAATAILAALIARGHTGKGQHIDISLFDTQIQWLANIAHNVLFSGHDAGRLHNAHPSIVPYQAFAAADGWLVVAAGNDRQWQHLCSVIERPTWADSTSPFASNPQRVENRAELVPQLAAIFAEKPVATWLTQLEAGGIPCGRVNTVQQALNHPVTQARHMTFTLDNVPQVASPLHLAETPPSYRTAPPACGQHTREVLTAHGYSPADIAKLAADKVINP